MNRWARTRQGDEEQTYAEAAPGAEPQDDSRLPRTTLEEYRWADEPKEAPPLPPERMAPSKLSASQHAHRGDEAMSDAEAAMAEGDYARAAAFSQFATAHYSAASAKRKWR